MTMELDLERLLAPIPGDRPAGESLRYEGTYDAVNEARRSDDPTLPQGVWKTKLKESDPDQVIELCTEAIEKRSKDLQLVAWLTEALVQKDGLFGLAQGLHLILELCRRDWPDLFPELEEDDLDARLAPIEWLNDKVSLKLKQIDITRDPDAGASDSWAAWERALHRPEDVGEGEEEPGAPTRSSILARASLTPISHYRSLLGDVELASQALKELHDELEARCGAQAPSLGEFEGFLENVRNFAHRVLSERGAEVGQEAAGDGGAKSGPTDFEAVAPEQSGGAITSRAEAYRLLSQAADYLLATEPHSPAPYLVRRAVAWGRLSLADLLAELMAHNADLGTVYQLLGIHKERREE